MKNHDDNEFQIRDDSDYDHAKTMGWLKLILFVLVMFAIVLGVTWLWKKGSKADLVEPYKTDRIERISPFAPADSEYMQQGGAAGADSSEGSAPAHHESDADVLDRDERSAGSLGAGEGDSKAAYGEGATRDQTDLDLPHENLDARGEKADDARGDGSEGEGTSEVPGAASGAAAPDVPDTPARAQAAEEKPAPKKTAAESKPKPARTAKDNKKRGPVELTPREILQGKAGRDFKERYKRARPAPDRNRELTPREILQGKAGEKYR